MRARLLLPLQSPTSVPLRATQFETPPPEAGRMPSLIVVFLVSRAPPAPGEPSILPLDFVLLLSLFRRKHFGNSVPFLYKTSEDVLLVLLPLPNFSKRNSRVQLNAFQLWNKTVILSPIC